LANVTVQRAAANDTTILLKVPTAAPLQPMVPRRMIVAVNYQTEGADSVPNPNSSSKFAYTLMHRTVEEHPYRVRQFEKSPRSFGRTKGNKLRSRRKVCPGMRQEEDREMRQAQALVDYVCHRESQVVSIEPSR
jgi:hypothetical protein